MSVVMPVYSDPSAHWTMYSDHDIKSAGEIYALRALNPLSGKNLGSLVKPS